MAIQIAFDSSHNVIPPTLVLTTRNGDRLGGLLYHNLVVKQAIRQSMEMSFSVNKADYCEKNHNADLWNLIADFKLVWCKEWNCYFEINVTTNEEYTTDKEITAVSLGDAELSQINLYNIQINTEDDIARDDYEPTVLYNANDVNASLLHRIMEKVPHYTVKYVDPAVASIQRTFTFDNKSLYDAFQEIAEEMECVFDIECRHTINGIERSISVFDLENYGNDTNILLSTDALADNINYSIDTGAVKNCFRLEGGDDLMTATIRNCNPNGSGYIWYISNELKADMSDELVEQLEKYNEQYDYFYKYYNPFDTEIKNYTGKMLVGRLLEDYGYGGNVDLLHRPLVPVTNIANTGWIVDTTKTTETLHIITYPNSDGTIVGNFTPILTSSNGSYIRTLSPSEMEQYAAGVLSGETNDAETSNLQIGSLFYGDSAVQKAAEASDRITELQEYYYDTDNSNEFVNPGIITEFNSSIADKTDIINSYNTLVRKYQTYTDDYKEIKTPINGYPAIMEAYYNTIDFYYYLNDSLMPTSQMSDTNAQTEANKLHYQSLKNTAIQNLSSTTSVATVNSAIASMAKAIVDTRYQIKVLDDECSFNYSTTEGRSSTWNGKIKVTNYSDEEDTYTAELRSIPISSDYATFIQQKLNTVLANTRTDTVADISDIFKMDNSHFKAELKRYSLKRLEAFHDACQGCIDVLIQQGIADNSNTESDMYQQIYLPYYNKLGFIQSEMDVRQGELDTIAGKFDSEGGLLADGMQTILDKERNAIQSNLDFQDYLGSTLWQEFVAYRREDTYTNTNYVSDGLGNDELFARAMEFIQTAKDEIEKSATKQHTINARLKNLLVMKEFASIVKCFEVGNWLRLKVDGKLFKLRLVDYQIDFENLESIDITFSDIVVDGTDATAKDILNQAASMATSYNTVSRQARKGDKTSSVVDNFVNDGLALTTTKIIDTADNQEVAWDKHGLVCREYDSLTDSYSDTQVKLINKGVYVTDNKWRTAKAGIGNFTFFNPSANGGEGEYQEAYGVIADTLVGNLILGKSVGIYNTKNSITMDEDGFVLTTDGTGSDDPQSVFTIRRKTVNNGVKSFKDMFYIDSNGYVTINGGVKIDIDGANGNSTMVEMVDGKITAHITDELDNGGLIQSSISQTANSILSTVSNTYETIEDFNQKKSVLESSIEQTASNIASTVKATSGWDIASLNYTINIIGTVDRGSDHSAIGGYVAADHIGEFYLDDLTGHVYESKLESGSTTNYAWWWKTNLTRANSSIYSRIDQTANSITSTVSSAVSKYDTSSYTITLYGYGTPTDSGYAASSYNGKYYLDQKTGKLYLSNGSSWSNTTTLSLITDNLSSQIVQTAGEIKSTVANAVSKYDETGHTISIRDYGVPNTTAYPPANYSNQLYLNQENGAVYKSNGSAWSRHKNSSNQNVTLPLITTNLQTQIAQNATDITLKVSEGDLGTKIQQNKEAVKIAWNNNSQYIAFEGAALNIYNSSTQNNTTLLMKLNNTGLGLYEAVSGANSRLKMKMNSYGATYYCEGADVGTIGTSNMDTMKGLTFHLENDAQYMAWSWKESANADVYTLKFFYYPLTTYVAGSNTTYTKGFYFADDVYFRKPTTFTNSSGNSVTFNNTTTTFNRNVIFANNSNNSVIFNNPVTFNNIINAAIKMNGNTLYMSPYSTSDPNSYIEEESTGALKVVSRSDKALVLTGYGSKNIVIGGGGVTCNTNMSVSGNISATGTVTSGSDARVKTNIVNTNVNALSLLSNIELKEFDWLTDDTHTSVGIIAQQLQEVIPELVNENQNNGMLSIKVDRFIPFLVKSIQELYDLTGDKKNKSGGTKQWSDTISIQDKRDFLKTLNNKDEVNDNPKRRRQSISEPSTNNHIIVDVPYKDLTIQG